MTRPTAAQLEEARRIYLERLDRWGTLGVSGLRKAGTELTWAQVSRGGRTALDLAAFYYIGMLAGQTVAYPLHLILH